MPTVPTTTGPKQQLTEGQGVRFASPRGAAPDVQLRPSLLNTPQVRTQQIDTPQLKFTQADPGAIKPISLGDGGAAQAKQVGENLGRTSQVLDRAVLDYRKQVNATIADDALDQARQAAMRLHYGDPDGKGGVVGGFANLKGENAFRGGDGKSPVDALAEAFDKQAEAIAAGKLSNPDQQALFRAQISSVRDHLLQSAHSHAAEQFATYQDQVYKSKSDNLVAAFSLVSPVDRPGQQKILGELEGVIGTARCSRALPPR